MVKKLCSDLDPAKESVQALLGFVVKVGSINGGKKMVSGKQEGGVRSLLV